MSGTFGLGSRASARRNQLARAVAALLTGCSLLLVPGSAPVIGAGVGPTCDPAPGYVQVVGFQLLITARTGDANALQVAMTGGAYTPPGTGQALTTAEYSITDPGASFPYIPEVACASDEAATCTTDDGGVTTCSAILTDIVVDLWDGDDSASFAGVPAPVNAGGADGNDTIVGGENADNLLGGPAGDFIAGGGGNDTINGQAGWDTLEGGPGDDNISGGSTDLLATSGNDTIRGGPGLDFLDGGSGSLTDPDRDLLDYSDQSTPVVINLVTATGDDIVVGFEDVLGGSGDDDINGGIGPNRIDGGPGNDTIDGSSGLNELLGGEGDDIIYGSDDDETLDGGPGDDRLFDPPDYFTGFASNRDILIGGSGNDRLVAGTGDNKLFGDDGDDWLVAGCEALDFQVNQLFGGEGADTLSDAPEASIDKWCLGGEWVGDAWDIFAGGPGIDTVDLCLPVDPNSLDVPPGYRPQAEASIASCLRNGDQYATPTEAGHVSYRGQHEEQNTLIAMENVIGGGGSDLLFGSGGHVNGGPGLDDISCGAFLDGGPGGAGDEGDILRDCPGASYRSIADYSRRTGDLRVTLDGLPNDGSFDTATGASEGDNVLATGGVGAGSGNDVLTGDAGDNTLTGGAGNDELTGLAGDDALYGGDGHDTIDGGPGADVLDGGPGVDGIRARDGLGEVVSCGSGIDVGILDRHDQALDCETTAIGVIASLEAGESLTTDVEGDGADPAHPIEVTITAGNAGGAQATQWSQPGPNPTGFVLLGVRYDIRLPQSTADAPNILTFRVDASQVPAGQGPSGIFIYRNGVLVPDCDPAPPRVPTTAAPDPCVASRALLADGDVEIVVLTSRASDWDFAVDVEAPTVEIVAPPATSYLLHESATADYGCADAGSGLASCVGPVADGAPIDTSSVGSRTFTVTAADRVGNRSSQDTVYRVIYDFKGFFSPLENPGHVEGLLNLVKAGASVPVKFSLSGDQGLAILAPGYPVSGPVSCDATAPSDPLEETATPGSAQLSYDAATQTYTFVWKTQKSWAATCRRLTVRLVDGTDHVVLFRFKA